MDAIEPKITANKLKKLTKARIDAECARRNKKPEIVIFELLFEQPAVMWAAYDWDDVRLISQKAIALMLPAHSYLDTYKTMLRILMLYESVLSNYLTPVEPVKRLAVFINETASALIDDVRVREAMLDANDWPRQDAAYVRGKVIALITTPSCRKMLLNAPERYFFAELNCCGELPAQAASAAKTA